MNAPVTNAPAMNAPLTKPPPRRPLAWLGHELRLLLRSRLCVAALVLLGLLSSLAVLSGSREVDRQRDNIARLAALQAQDVAAVARRQAGEGSAGNAAYYTFHRVWDTPSGAAFLALGLRDVAPYVLRVRALGLQAQLYEGESFNPELALAGRFDFAFVLIYLAPLFIIALLHDLVSGERQAGRLRMLLALPGGGARLWGRRAGLRLAAAWGCLCLPLLPAAAVQGAGLLAAGTALAVAAAYVLFWGGLCLLLATRPWSSTAHGMALVGGWVVLTLVLPSLAQGLLARAIPVEEGVQLMLRQRQNIHGAWDEPRDATMQKFFRSHPQWRDTAPLPPHFHWKWYYAFQQLGDESVAADVQAYRSGLAARQAWTRRLGWLLPGVGAQAALHRLAQTDLTAQLAHQVRIEAFHRQIREFYYPYVFNDRPFGPQDFARMPGFSAPQPEPDFPAADLLPLLAWGLGLSGLGLWMLRRSRPD